MNSTYEKSPFIKISYITINSVSSKNYLDYGFFLVLDGSVRIVKGKEAFFLGKDDVFMFEPGIEHQVSSAGNNIILSIIIDNYFFKTGRTAHNGHYICNSAEDENRDYTPLRQLLARIAYTYFNTSDITHLSLMSHAYSLLYYLNAYHYEKTNTHRVSPINDKYHERLNSILNYIHQNYNSPITLQEAADTLHLSAPYLSSFFKQNMHENFNSYVNKVRLKHAVDELIYSDKTITDITFDNGFASMNAFDRLFKEIYGTTPNRYRKEKNRERQLQTQPEPDSVLEHPAEKWTPLLPEYGKDTAPFFHEIKFPVQRKITVPDMRHAVPVKLIWKDLINLGPLSMMPKRDIDKQLDQLQEHSPFRYGRIEFTMDYKLFFNHDAENGPYDFNVLTSTLDLMKTRKMIPYLDFSVPLDQLEKNPSGNYSLDLNQYISALKALFINNLNIYGADNIRYWYYEISPHYDLTTSTHEQADAFINRFEASYKLIRNYLPDAKIGGICHPALASYDNLRLILSRLKELKITPDFLSLGIFPYETSAPQGTETSARAMFYTRNKNFARDKVAEFKSIVSEYFNVLPEIHIAYIAPDYFSGSYLNDTCFQSTFFFHNTVDLTAEVDMIGYYQLSDLCTPSNGMRFLEGSCGFYNKYGLLKPGGHLLGNFAKFPDYLIQKGEDYIILGNNLDRYTIGLCNYIYIDEYSGLTTSQSLSIRDAYKIYESPRTDNVELHLNNMPVGDYDIILYQINPHHGSVLDEWARNGYWNRFSMEELDYMRRTIQPRRTHDTRFSSDGTMTLQFQLEPHEVVFIILLHRWGK